MRFHYIASEPEGKVVEGDLEANGPAEVLEWMASQGLRPVSVKAMAGVESRGLGRIFSQPINVADKVFLTKYLALMLKVGTDLFKAIDILIADFDKPAVKSLLIEIKDSLSKGQPFYSTFTKYPKYFSSVFVNLIKAGEASGNLDNVFEDLSVGLEKEQAIRSRVKSVLVYPVVLVFLALTILLLLITFALPRIAEVFTSGGIEPPIFSRVVFAVGIFLGDYALIVFPGLIGLIFGAWYILFKTVGGITIRDRLLSHTPIVGGVLYRIALQRFATTFSSLLRSGMPILDALEITAESVGHAELRAALLRISREGITKGLTIGEAFRREPVFPRVVVNLIAISEKAGHIESILDTLADFYETEIDGSIKTLISFLEPALLLVIGFVVGIIALSIIVPVYQLVTEVSQ
jgi:type IV pilus assembly protein PilC